MGGLSDNLFVSGWEEARGRRKDYPFCTLSSTWKGIFCIQNLNSLASFMPPAVYFFYRETGTN
jgi:hypothetical protein